MKTYFVYWTPQTSMYAKVEAESPEAAYKAVSGALNDPTKAKVIYEEVEEVNETSYEVYEDNEKHTESNLVATFHSY